MGKRASPSRIFLEAYSATTQDPTSDLPASSRLSRSRDPRKSMRIVTGDAHQSPSVVVLAAEAGGESLPLIAAPTGQLRFRTNSKVDFFETVEV